MEKIKRSELPQMRMTLLQAKDVKSTTMGMLVLNNLEIVNKHYNAMQDEIVQGTNEIQDRHKHLAEKIAVFNKALQANMTAMINPQTGQFTNEPLFRSNVEEIVKNHPECEPFYVEQKTFLEKYYESEVEIDLKFIKADDLPDNLSANDIIALSAFITDGELVT